MEWVWEHLKRNKKKVASVLERQEDKTSTASKRGIFTIERWCKGNGYGGVTEACITAALQSQDPKINKMAKRAKLESIVKGDTNE